MKGTSKFKFSSSGNPPAGAEAVQDNGVVLLGVTGDDGGGCAFDSQLRQASQPIARTEAALIFYRV